MHSFRTQLSVVLSLFLIFPAQAIELGSEHRPSPDPLVDEEMIVVAPPAETTSEAMAKRILDTHASSERGRQLYLRHRYTEAHPHLLAAAKRGFKMAQARLGEIHVLGLGNIDQDTTVGMAWLGVAASGTTLPAIRNRFNELKTKVPAQYHRRLDEVVASYAAKYGTDSNELNCFRTKTAGTHITKLRCEFANEWMFEPYLRHMASEEALNAIGAFGF